MRWFWLITAVLLLVALMWPNPVTATLSTITLSVGAAWAMRLDRQDRRERAANPRKP
jgi:hypothetical protein